MMIKFHKASSSGGSAADYLEDVKDHKGRPREKVEVLRGDPYRVGQIADSLDFKHRLTACVIAWAPEDNPSPEQIDEVLDNFEHLAWAGLDPERYAWSAVRHEEPSGGVHVHIMAARVDLQTGKSLNIAPPGWQRDFDPLRDMQNNKHGWARPDDPARANDVHLESYEKKIKAEAVKSGEPPATLDIEVLTDYLIERIHMGHINHRTDIKAALEELNDVTVTRAGRNYISVKLPGVGKATRLRGEIYDEQFNGDVYRQDKAAAGRTGTRTPETHPADFAAAQGRYHAAVRRRGEFNRRKYGEHQTLAENESDVQVVDLPTHSHLIPAAVPVGGGKSDRGIRGQRTQQDPHCAGEQQTSLEDNDSVGRTGQSDRWDTLPVNPRQTRTRRDTKHKRRGLVRKSGVCRQTTGGEISHDRARRTTPGRSDQTGGWYELSVRAIDSNKRALGRFNKTYANSTKRFGEVFKETTAILRGAAEIILAAAQVAKTLYGIVKKAMTPTYSGPEPGGR